MIANYLQIIRPKNLVIVAVSQMLIYGVYLMPLTIEQSDLILNGNLWMLFVLDTILIAAGGYVVNDLMDQQADHYNKPDKIYIGKGKIPAKVGWAYYALIVLVGFILAYYIAFNIGKIHLLLIYPAATGLLFLYSMYFKKMPLLGNMIVSLFCAFVPGIIWYAEFDTLQHIAEHKNQLYEILMHLFPAYISFAFLSTFVREVIKDIEDLDGDMQSSYHTLPVVAGVDRAKVIAFFLGIILLGSYAFWFFDFDRPHAITVGGIITLALILPTLYIVRLIYKARSTADYSAISKKLKYLMIVSLFVFLCIPFILQA